MQRPFAPANLLLFLWLTLRAGSAFAQAPLKFEHLTVKDGLSDNLVWSMLQDRKGYLWFGTLDGLNKYDGYTITTYKYTPHDPTSIAHNVIFKIWEDKQGLIWIGTVEGGICKFDPSTEQFTSYRIPQPKNSFVPALREVSAINEDQEGLLWVGNRGGELRRFNKKTGRFSEKYVLKYQSSEDETNRGLNSINTIYNDRMGTLWFGTQAGMHKLLLTPGKAGKPTQVRFQQYQHDSKNPNSLSGKSVLSIYQDRKGLLWIGTGNQGLNRFDPKTGVFTRYQHDPKNSHSLNSNSQFVLSAAEDIHGNLWIGTLNGLNKLNGEQTEFTRYLHDPTDATSLGSDLVTNVLTDKAGSLWVGTFKGVSRTDPHQPPFMSYGYSSLPANALRGAAVSALYEDKFGILWIATEQGLDALDRKTGRFTHYGLGTKIQSYSSGIQILEDRNALFWVSSGDKLMRFDPKTGGFISSSGSPMLDKQLANQSINTLYEDRRGLLWIGSHPGVRSFDRQTGTIREYGHDPTNPQTISDYQVSAIQEDNQGNLWFGHGSVAVSKLNRKTGRITRYQHRINDSTSLSSNAVNCIHRDSKGGLWFGTVAGGLCRFNEQSQTFTTFTEKQGLANNTINAIVEDDQGTLWLNTSNGLSRFSPTTHTFTNYDTQDGLQSNQLSRAAWKGRDGTLYVGSDNGFNAFKPEDIRPNHYVPPVVITRFRLFDNVLPGKSEAAEIELSYQQNFISFEYAALNYTNSQKNQYRYQLEGVDPDWVQAGTRRLASYTDLSPGDYTFRVKGSNNSGVWNEQGAAMRILIRPPWWRTWWAYTLYALLSLTGIWAAIYYRSVALRRENRLLEQKVALRTEQLQKSLDTLKTTQTQLIQQEKMASLGELTAGIAHEIQNPLNFVTNFSEVSTELVEELKEEVAADRKTEALEIAADLTQNLEKITLHGQRASSIVRGMLEHSRASSGERQPTDLNALADEYLRLAYHGLRRSDVSAKDKDGSTARFNAELKTDFDPNLGKVDVVPPELGRVLLNLFNNAFYAVQEKQKKSPLTPEGGIYQPTVQVSTRQQAPPSGRSDGSAGRAWVEIRVTDNGTGMSEAVKVKIFQLFFTTKPTGQGTGLGLSLAYDIVTKGHGGMLRVESIEGQGTEFVISLPTA